MPDVATMIQEARWEDPSFTEHRHTGAFLRAALADYQDELLGKIAQVNPEELAEVYVVTLPLADFAAGHELVELDESEEVALRYKVLLDWGEAIDSQGFNDRARHIAMGSRWGPHRYPSYWVRDGRLYLIGDAKDWTGYVQLNVPYVPLAPATLASTDNLILDDQARRVWKSYLAHRMAQRSNQDELARSKNAFAEEWLMRERELLEDFEGRHVTTDVVTEVW